ncbi:MAG: DUF2007 domain-containing protein [Spirochaetes bacterium]|nr:DUF2007 domain-containing protein [Spirochaetota bacterium]
MNAKKKEQDDLIVFHSGPIVEIKIIKAELEKHKIEVFQTDENMSFLDPSRISPGGLAPFRIMIRKKDLQKAKKIIDAFLKKNSKK